LFLSHFHLDHIIGIHILNKFKFSQLYIYGPPKTKEILENLVNFPYTSPISNLPYKVEIYEISNKCKIPFQVKYLPLLHSPYSIGYRIEIEGKMIAYCADTGICNNAIKIAKDADLLIAECSFKSGQRNPKWPHLNPEDAALIAKKSNAKKLVLTHFDADIYKTLRDREEAGKKAKEIFKNTIVAFDDKIIEI